jgi:hypothetical protein
MVDAMGELLNGSRINKFEGKPYELGAEGGYRFANHARIRIPENFDWNRVWQALVESCRRCADIAAPHGKTVIQGYLGLDLGLTDSLVEDYRASVERIKSIASELDLTIEI